MSAQNGGGEGKKAQTLRTNSIDFADREGGGGRTIPKFCGRQMWKEKGGTERNGRGRTDGRTRTALKKWVTSPEPTSGACGGQTAWIGVDVTTVCLAGLAFSHLTVG